MFTFYNFCIPKNTQNFSVLWRRYCNIWICWCSLWLYTKVSNKNVNKFYILSQHPGWIHPGKFPGGNLLRKITTRRKTFGFFTSPTILHNLFHPGKYTASLIVPSEFCISPNEFWYYPCEITDKPWCVATSHWNHGNAR